MVIVGGFWAGYWWPASFVVAKPYLDQLTRSKGLVPERVTALTTAMDNLR